MTDLLPRRRAGCLEIGPPIPVRYELVEGHSSFSRSEKKERCIDGHHQHVGRIRRFDLGDMRQVLKKRFGEKTKLELVASSRSLFGKKAASIGLPGLDTIAAGLASGLAEAAEEKALWGRYGL